MSDPLLGIVIGLAIIAALVALHLKDLLAAVVSFGVFSFLMALLYAALGAVDVAFNEAVIGAGISGIFFVLTIFLTTRRGGEENKQPPPFRILRGLLLAGTGACLIYGGLSLPLRGGNQTPSAQHVSPRYITQAVSETKTPNMVTAVLADYRSFDTLGETLVIFTAGLACLFMIGLPARRRDRD